MIDQEALKLCRMAKALSPAQAVDEFTPTAWSLILRKVRYCDAELALEELGGEQVYIHVSHIVKRVKRIRRDRIDDFGTLPDPPSSLDPADTEGYQRWLAETTRAIADGNPPPRPATGQLTARGVNYAELMPKVPADNEAITTARAGISAARADLCTLHRAKPCRICERARARDTESTQPEGASA